VIVALHLQLAAAALLFTWGDVLAARDDRRHGRMLQAPRQRRIAPWAPGRDFLAAKRSTSRSRAYRFLLATCPTGVAGGKVRSLALLGRSESRGQRKPRAQDAEVMHHRIRKSRCLQGRAVEAVVDDRKRFDRAASDRFV
jgi:hypothetical protein